MTVGQQLVSRSLSFTPHKAEVLKPTLCVKKKPTQSMPTKLHPLTGPRDARAVVDAPRQLSSRSAISESPEPCPPSQATVSPFQPLLVPLLNPAFTSSCKANHGARMKLHYRSRYTAINLGSIFPSLKTHTNAPLPAPEDDIKRITA